MNISTTKIENALVAAGWDADDLDDDFVARVGEAIESGREALISAIAGGGTYGEAAELADAILAHLGR